MDKKNVQIRFGLRQFAKNARPHDKLTLTSGYKKNNYIFVTIIFKKIMIFIKKQFRGFFVFQIYETNETKFIPKNPLIFL
jgi:hypothetical protein